MNWRKSTYSGGGEGNICVEIAEAGPRIAVRDPRPRPEPPSPSPPSPSPPPPSPPSSTT
ncbi:DUF397 domain-containing protein [Streptomyces sp. LUP47B]|uniref:DUF397 domain-containing protein n=1 Tax=Streptomyces sp. LUP47B TaxID=1890286 RepID=UPI0009A01973|nr:DUF397 domain-containing protein [Streptomyces sp. LUP47B]